MTKCALCGEAMPAGEEMFKYHGHSGPCPASPKGFPPPKKPLGFKIEVGTARDDDGHWLQISVDGKHARSIGPFASEGERRAACEDLLAMLRSVALVS